MKRGLFITFEGGDGAGKTTLINALANTLTSRGLSVLKTREPGGTHLGEDLRNLVLQKREEKVSPFAELCLFLASRAQHVFEVIRPALEAGQIVFCDRFHDSSVAYQGIARGLGASEVASMSSFVTEHLQPDLTFYLDLPPSIGLERVKGARQEDRLESEAIAFHEKIRAAYITIQKENPTRVKKIDGLLSSSQVYEEAIHILDPLIRPFP